MAQTFHSEDITFCSSACDRTNCYRHPDNIRDNTREHTFAEMKGTVYCSIRPEQIRRRGKRNSSKR